ncbi:MAG TPA: Gfo/Idh/MocA family oxidoreductase, partial [Fimbriimonadaceae bacterium]|nr:Gfo/Idh/MocA family oxidoreductase [Fimbriimonadaceae bacterium]
MAQISRREFMAGAAAATAAFAAPNIIAGGLKQDRIKVGMVGCGGRGTGAAVNSTQADEGVVIWAMGDLFQDRLDGSRNYLSGQIKERLQVPKERQFVGFDAYKHVIAQDVDYVILATPPAFRPMMLEAAVDAGKNVFFEKPVATDAFGIRKVIGAANKAKDMGLSLVTGTQRRHDKAYMECMDRIHNGQIGDVVATYAYWNQGGLWMHPRQKEWSDLEWEIRNWLYFTWLSGDHIVEQHVHNLDVSNWSKNGHPVKCTSLGGRQVRTDPAYGQIFDHFATEYEYEDGTKLLSMCRQIDNCASRVSEYIVGTKGKSNANTSITGENPWRWDG